MAGQVVNLFLLYHFLKRLTTPFEKWDAYKLDIIDKDGALTDHGEELKRKPSTRTKEERDAWRYFDILVRNLKRLLEKIPGGKSTIASYAAALLLLKEHKNESIYDNDELLIEKLEENINLIEEGQMPSFNEFREEISAGAKGKKRRADFGSGEIETSKKDRLVHPDYHNKDKWKRIERRSKIASRLKKKLSGDSDDKRVRDQFNRMSRQKVREDKKPNVVVLNPEKNKHIVKRTKGKAKVTVLVKEDHEKLISNLAKMHNVSTGLIKKEFAMGMEVEKEHTDDYHELEKIVNDHLKEVPDYYTKLKKHVEESKSHLSGGHYVLVKKGVVFAKGSAKEMRSLMKKCRKEYPNLTRKELYVGLSPGRKVGDIWEDAPANAVGNYGTPSSNIKGYDPILMDKMFRRKKPQTFAGSAVFKVKTEQFMKARYGKNRYHSYLKSIGECDEVEEIRSYGRNNPGKGIILQDSKNGAMVFLRKPKGSKMFSENKIFFDKYNQVSLDFVGKVTYLEEGIGDKLKTDSAKIYYEYQELLEELLEVYNN